MSIGTMFLLKVAIALTGVTLGAMTVKLIKFATGSEGTNKPGYRNHIDDSHNSPLPSLR